MKSVLTKEQLDKIVAEEVAKLTDVDRITNSGELHEKLDAFITSLQGRLDSLDNPVRKEAEVALRHELELDDAVSAEQARDVAQKIIMDLEREFNVYNIKASNGIVEQQMSKSEKIRQVAIGTAIASVALWFFWPAPNDGLVDEQVTIAEIADQNAITAAEESASDIAVLEKPSAIELAPTAATPVEPVAAPEPAVKTAGPAAEPEAPATPEQAAPVSGEKIMVTAHVGNVRNAPDNSGKRITRVKKGDVVVKTDEKLGWYHVRLENGNTGWIYKTVFAPRLQVGVDVANVRIRPSNSADVIGKLKKGDFVTRVGEEKGWYQVKMDGGVTAWVHSSLF